MRLALVGLLWVAPALSQNEPELSSTFSDVVMDLPWQYDSG